MRRFESLSVAAGPMQWTVMCNASGWFARLTIVSHMNLTKPNVDLSACEWQWIFVMVIDGECN